MTRLRLNITVYIYIFFKTFCQVKITSIIEVVFISLPSEKNTQNPFASGSRGGNDSIRKQYEKGGVVHLYRNSWKRREIKI